MLRNWMQDFGKFDNFLKNIPVEKWSYLRQIKTVEQDLPKELLPLEIYYKYYWDSTNFINYNEIFKIYWGEKLSPYIYNFIKKYFYGCSIQFVEEGFKARLYRIWMSILTQFHFQYLWNARFDEKLESNPKLDSMGIDAILNLSAKIIGIQVKKISYRREASNRRFTKRQKSYADIIAEVPYIVIDLDEIKRKIESSRTRENTKEKCRAILNAFNNNFIKYDNGFVVFKEVYLKNVYKMICQKVSKMDGEKITYDEILKW